MKIKKFNPSTVKVGRGTRYVKTISFNRKSGLVSINLATSQALNITQESKLTFVQDQDKPKDWYVMHDPNGYSLRRSSASASIIFVCRELCIALLESINVMENAARIIVSDTPVSEGDKVIYPLVTRLYGIGKSKIESNVKRF